MSGAVECHSGAEYAESPRRFLWQGAWRDVDRVYAERRTPNGKQFEVLDEERDKFILTYDTENDSWTILPAP